MTYGIKNTQPKERHYSIEAQDRKLDEEMAKQDHYEAGSEEASSEEGSDDGW